MPSLKALRTRINSVKSTQKITSAMKMVAASKLRRAQQQAEAARPYAERMERMLRALAASVSDMPNAPALLAGTGKDQTYLLVPVTADRGLAGAFNTNIGRATRTLARRLEADGKTVKILAVGRKGRDYLRRELASRITGDISLCRQAADRILRCRGDRQPDHRHAGCRRDRRLHPDLQPVPLGDLPDRHRTAADPRAAPAGGRKRPISAAPATSSSRTRRPSWRGCCRRRWQSSCTARCWRVPPANTARE